MSRDEDEKRLEGVVAGALRRWLGKARDAVMKPWRQFKLQPDPTAVYGLQQQWNDEVDTIMTVIGQIAQGAWNQASNVPAVSRHSFVMATLAQTENLLVRIPDEVYNLIFAEIADATNAGQSNEEIANRIDQVLTFTNSERWPNRAKTIATTEVTRAYGAGTIGAGMEMSRVSGQMLQKQWQTENDERVRMSHRAVDGQVQALGNPFYVDGFPMMFPGDPLAPPELVVNCRCDLLILNGEG